jgi:hypothetical protein
MTQEALNNKIAAFIEVISTNTFRGWNSLEYTAGAEGGGQEVYVSFRAVLRFIAENLNLFTAEGTSSSPLLEIDWRSDKPMFMFSTAISCNLQKCYIRNSLLKTSIGTLVINPKDNKDNAAGIAAFHAIDYFEEKALTDLRDNMRVTSSTSSTYPAIYPSIGNINNIYLNIAYLTDVMVKESDNEEGKVSVRKYLQVLCNGVNKALGSINDLQVVIDEDASTPYLTIIDYQQKRIKGLSGKLSDNKETTLLKGQGLGSMLTNISAQSSITPEVATMISVGAQAQGYVLGEEAVSFSKLSAGLLDRVYPNKVISNAEAEAEAKTAAERAAKVKEKFQEAMNTYASLVEKQKPASAYGPIILTADDQTDYENVATDFYKYILAQFTETGQTATAFIPIKLSFNMRGIGGMKIYQKFKLSDDILPMSYSTDYEFIIMGISHTVDSSKWDTAVSATISLVDKPTELEKFSIPLEVVDLSTGGSAGGSYSTGSKKSNKVIVGGVETTVTNGEVPDEYMRELNETLFPYLKWKGSTLTSDGGRIRLLKPIMDNLERMLTAYTKDNPNTPMLINSAYRTYPDQVRVRKEWERKGKPKNAAYPGTSNHGFGRAVDFADKGGTMLTPSMPQYKWIKANASTYGFTRIYSSTEGEAWEAWHWQDLTTQEIPGTAPAAAGAQAAVATAGTTYFP